MILLSILGITLTCFGGSYLLFKLFNRGRDPTQKWFWFLGATTSIVFSIVAPYIFLLVLIWPSSPKPFDPHRWKAEPTERTAMVDDLIKRRILDSLTKSDVIELLGEPTETSYFKETGRDLTYHLGSERHPFAVDSEWLLIWLKENKVTRYEIRRD
jgi:hypothetical protein